jgi:hypothetical protein
MNDDPERQKRLEIVRRIAIGMAEKNSDPILNDVQILTASTFEGNPKSEEELDSRNPVATQTDGGRYFTHVRMDGRGQLNIIWPTGVEKTLKFWIPEKYLSEEMADGNRADRSQAPTQRLESPQNQASELELAMERMKKADSNVPTSLSGIPGFPFTDFRTMQSAVDAGRFVIAKFSFHQDLTILGLVSPTSRFLYLASMVATYIIPIASVVLAFTVSHWFWLGLLYFFVGARLTITIWKNSILRAAYRSELAFCLLFYTSKVNAYDLTTSTEYEWQQLKEKG